MPQRSFDALTEENRQRALDYRPGYDWIPGRFGPPPGIPQEKKDQLDQLSDRDFLFAFMKLSQEEKESLMISEAERRRTFTSHWPIWNIVDGFACAKEGFYYTGVSDRVQCAFCAGIIRNWERGDNAQDSHRRYFSYCKMAQRKPCHNIPYDNSDIPQELLSNQLSMVHSSNPSGLKLKDLGINDNQPKHSSRGTYVSRIGTYSRYGKSNPVSAEQLCDAGFFYEGPGDKVRCFWCDGALELWSKGDDPWVEHAKWYPGCAFVRQSKGAKFIKNARSLMSDEDVQTSSTLIYNRSDLSFIEHTPELPFVEELESFKLCVKLGFDDQLIKKAFKENNGNDFDDVQDLITAIFTLYDGNSAEGKRSLAELKVKLEGHRGRLPTAKELDATEATQSTREIFDLEELISRQQDLDEEQSQKVISALTCPVCQINTVGAVVLPCGHFCLCHECSRQNLPNRCPQCDSVVKGACRAFLN